MQASSTVPQLDIEHLFQIIYTLITGEHNFSGIVGAVVSFWDFINFISIFAAPLFLFGIIFVVIRSRQLFAEDKEQFEAAVARVRGEERESSRWQTIVDAVASSNPVEWRHAVIDADVMLDEALKELGYVGETLGERLKNVPAGGIQNINAAWEAHRVRNEIAHAGSDFILSQREARRAIDNYRLVFDELGII